MTHRDIDSHRNTGEWFETGRSMATLAGLVTHREILNCDASMPLPNQGSRRNSHAKGKGGDSYKR